MWFKVFVLLRLPVSVICMLGYSFALGAWGGFDMAFLAGVLVVGLYIFIAYTSLKLFRFRKGALLLTGWLLALETIGAVLLVSGGDYMATGTFDPLLAFAVACVAVLVWTLPNALLFYRARSLFVEDSKPKK